MKNIEFETWGELIECERNYKSSPIGQDRWRVGVPACVCVRVCWGAS